MLRPAVLHDVPQGLLGDTIDDRLVDIGQAPVIDDLGRHDDPPRRHLGTKIGHRVGKPGRPEVRRVQLDEQRSGLPHRRTDPLRASFDRGLLRGVRGPVGRAGQIDRDPGERLDQPVMELTRDPAPLLVGAVRRALEQALAGLVAGPKVARQSPGERPLDDREQRQAGEHQRQDLLGEETSGREDQIEAQVGLDQERRPIERLDRDIDLDQPALVALEPVLGGVELADVRCGGDPTGEGGGEFGSRAGRRCR